jgi:hypothetical protein
MNITCVFNKIPIKKPTAILRAEIEVLEKNNNTSDDWNKILSLKIFQATAGKKL